MSWQLLGTGKTCWRLVDRVLMVVDRLPLVAAKHRDRQIEQHEPTNHQRVINRFSPIAVSPQQPLNRWLTTMPEELSTPTEIARTTGARVK